MALLDHIYEAVADDEAFGLLPAAIAADAGARSCVLMNYDSTLKLQAAAISHFTQEMIDFQLIEDVRGLDMWTSYGAQPHRLGKVGNGDRIWDEVEFLRSPFYNECIKRFGDDTVAVVGGVIQTPSGFLTMAVHRGLRSRQFEARDAAVVTAVAPHVFRMLDLRRRLDASDARGDLLQHLLDNAPGGIVAIDRGLRVRAANSKAHRIATLGDGVAWVGDRLTIADGPTHERFIRAVHAAAAWSGGRADAILVPRPSGQAGYRLLVSPLPGPQMLALLIMDDPAGDDPDLETSLSGLFGLTAAEAAIAVLLVEGLTPEEAAEARQVRMSTIRSQIKSLLYKTEARRLTDLVRLLARTPRRPPQP